MAEHPTPFVSHIDGQCTEIGFRNSLSKLPTDRDLILDMSDISFMTEEMAGDIVVLYKYLTSTAHKLWLVLANKQPIEKLARTNLHTLFPVRSSVQEVLEEARNVAS
ncbi:hypothetical protein H6770_04855 [Candidatus Peribacteria bacterium]|nr:hypothetical protein [Candidatus Peribacteria bacterium]